MNKRNRARPRRSAPVPGRSNAQENAGDRANPRPTPVRIVLRPGTGALRFMGNLHETRLAHRGHEPEQCRVGLLTSAPTGFMERAGVSSSSGSNSSFDQGQGQSHTGLVNNRSGRKSKGAHFAISDKPFAIQRSVARRPGSRRGYTDPSLMPTPPPRNTIEIAPAPEERPVYSTVLPA